MIRLSCLSLMALGLAGLARADSDAAAFREASRNFGTVPHGVMCYHTFRFTNKTNQDIRIGGIRVSCGCVSANAENNTVAAGQTGAIVTQMNTGRFSNSRTVTVFVQLESPRYEEVRLSLTANSRDDVIFTPESLSLGNVKKGSEPTGSMKITLYGANWKIIGATTESSYIKATVKELQRDNNQVTYQINAQLSPKVPVGNWYSDVWLKTETEGLPAIRVPLSVVIEPAAKPEATPAKKPVNKEE